MESVLEFAAAFVAIWIYGTKDNPRHPVWRNTVRIVAFSGAFFCLGFLLNLFGGFDFPVIVILVWLFCSVIVISAEYYVGSKPVCYVALLVFAALIALAVGSFV